MAGIRVVIPRKLIDNKKVKKKVQKAMIQAAKETAKRLVAKIHSGKDPATGKLYKELTKSTIESRKRVAKNNPTSSKYSPKRSNLTITGRFLESFRSKVRKTASLGFILTIFTKGRHKGYKTASGKTSKSVNNTDILKYQQDMGRDPLAISDKELLRLERLIKRLTRKNLRKS